MSGHAEVLDLACRLAGADAASARELRRELLRYWYGSGASHLRAEDTSSAGLRAEQERLANRVSALAAEADPAAEAIRRLGEELTAHVLRRERELAAASSG